MSPARRRDERPPVPVVPKINRPGGRMEHERTRHQQVQVGVGVVGRVRLPFRESHVPCGANEPAELRDGNPGARPSGRRRPTRGAPGLLRVVVARRRPEFAAGNPSHRRRPGAFTRSIHAVGVRSRRGLGDRLIFRSLESGYLTGGRCRGRPEVFYPTRGSTTAPAKASHPRRLPVREPCLADAPSAGTNRMACGAS
jgi:hypothetical protein